MGPVDDKVWVVVPLELIALVEVIPVAELEEPVTAELAVKIGSVGVGYPGYINRKLSSCTRYCVPVILLLRKQLLEADDSESVTPTQPNGIARL